MAARWQQRPVWGGRGYITTSESLAGGKVYYQGFCSPSKNSEFWPLNNSVWSLFVCVYVQSISTWLRKTERQIIVLFQKTLDPSVSDRVRMVATVLSGKDLALEVRAGLKRKVRSQRALVSENLVWHNPTAGGGDQEQWSQFQARPGHCPGKKKKNSVSYISKATERVSNNICITLWNVVHNAGWYSFSTYWMTFITYEAQTSYSIRYTWLRKQHWDGISGQDRREIELLLLYSSPGAM